MRPLFRRLSSESQHPLSSEPLIVAPISTKLASVAALLVLIATLLAAGLIHYPRRATAAGTIVAENGSANVMADDSSTVLLVGVELGAVVKAGQHLAVLGAERTSAKGESERSLILREEFVRRGSLEAELSRISVQESVLIQRSVDMQRSLERDRVRLTSDVDIQRERLLLKEQEIVRTQSLVDSGFMSAAGATKLSDDRLVLRASVASAERLVDAADRQLSQAKADDASTKSQLAARRAEIERALSEIRQQDAVRSLASEHAITSPIDGVIARVGATQGQTVQASTVLFVVHPVCAVPVAELCVGARDLPEVRQGQSVRLFYDAFPVERFGAQEAVITAVSHAPLVGRQGFAATDRCFLVRAQPTRRTIETPGGEMSIPLETPVRATIQLEDRSLLSAVLSPLVRAGKSL